MPNPHKPWPATAGPPSPNAGARPPLIQVDRDIAPSGEHCDAWLIALHGAIDADAVTRLERQVSDALTGYDRVVIDLCAVSVLGTPTLALLCRSLRQAHRPGSTFVIAGAPPVADRTLRICELPGVELHATPAELRDGAQHAPAPGDQRRLAA